MPGLSSSILLIGDSLPKSVSENMKLMYFKSCARPVNTNPAAKSKVKAKSCGPKVQNLFMANQTFFVHFTMTACRAVVQVSSSRVQLGNYIKYYSTCNFHHLHLEQFCGSVTSSFRGLLLCLLIYSSHY